MIEILVVMSQARAMSERQLPGEANAADRAVAAALRASAGGASASEACREGRRLLDCWARHASRHRTPSVCPPVATAGEALRRAG